MKILHLAKTK